MKREAPPHACTRTTRVYTRARRKCLRSDPGVFLSVTLPQLAHIRPQRAIAYPFPHVPITRSQRFPNPFPAVLGHPFPRMDVTSLQMAYHGNHEARITKEKCPSRRTTGQGLYD